MEFFAKRFLELSVDELYEILKSRTEIFLLEQNIVCQDMDDKDRESLHCFFRDGNRVVGYLRAFCSDSESVTIGRVLTLDHKKGMGKELMTKSVEEIKRHFGCKKILVHAQKQAAGFYEKMGFSVISEEYMEEGISHLTMEMVVV
ncbi:MAG: GNAT family N-acetyltransferase [Clostridia bacterium]|nr:GNAT family N-acetyltransferase [Clostridia bacterium]